MWKSKYKWLISLSLFLTISLQQALAEDLTEKVFTEIYSNKIWGKNEEARSGPGSTLATATPYIKFLENFIKQKKIQSVVDIGCGNWSFAQYMNWENIHYTGIDIVKSIIEQNQKQFSSPTITFIHGNGTRLDLPKADLLLCKDVLQHLPNEDIIALLQQTGKFKHCLITNDINPNTFSSTNTQISPGSYRSLDLTKPPFNVDGIKIFTYPSDHNVIKQVLHITNRAISSENTENIQDNKKVLIAILARNKAHVLPKYLKCIENLDYDKKNIGIYIYTNNNIDNTKEILANWMQKNINNYQSFWFKNYDFQETHSTDPHNWNLERFKRLGKIRNKSMQKARKYDFDYYFIVDCDNFITPWTLKELIQKNKPIIAPMLTSIPDKNDPYSNYFCAITKNGYYRSHPDYRKILNRQMVGTFKVPVVHCTYLIQSQYIDKLNYLDETNDFEFVIFSRLARKNSVDQYICNEKDFGVLLHFQAGKSPKITLEEEQKRVASIPLLNDL